MSKFDEDIKIFEEKVDRIRKKSIGIRESSKFIHGLYFHPLMKVIGLTVEELDLGHTLLHKCYNDKNPQIPKNWITQLHTKFVKEFKRRKKKHYNFDILDNINDNI